MWWLSDDDDDDDDDDDANDDDDDDDDMNANKDEWGCLRSLAEQWLPCVRGDSEYAQERYF